MAGDVQRAVGIVLFLLAINPSFQAVGLSKDDVNKIFRSKKASEFNSLFTKVRENTRTAHASVRNMRDNSIPDLSRCIQQCMNDTQQLGNENRRKQDGIDGIDDNILNLENERSRIREKIGSITTHDGPDTFVTSIYSQINDLTVLKEDGNKKLFDCVKELELARFKAFNLYSLLELRKHCIPEDFSDAIKREEAKIVVLESTYSKELAALDKLSDRRKQVLIEEEIEHYKSKIENLNKFNNEIEQTGLEGVERQFQERLENARTSLRHIQQRVEEMIQEPFVLEKSAVVLKHLRNIQDSAKSALEKYKDTFKKCESQITQIRDQNADLNSKISKLQQILELRRRQEENYQADNLDALEKIMLKIHEFNLGLIKSGAEIKFIGDKTKKVRESIRRREELYMILSVAGSLVYYLYQIAFLFE